MDAAMTALSPELNHIPSLKLDKRMTNRFFHVSDLKIPTSGERFWWCRKTPPCKVNGTHPHSRWPNWNDVEGPDWCVWRVIFPEEFNDRILCPELSDPQKKMLHEELKKIYETYCLDESVDKIRFDPFIVEEIRNSKWQGSVRHRQTSATVRPVTHPCLFDLPVAEGPYTEVVKLQTMRCLFEAYEHVLSLLENVFTPMFCHSDEVSVLAQK